MIALLAGCYPEINCRMFLVYKNLLMLSKESIRIVSQVLKRGFSICSSLKIFNLIYLPLQSLHRVNWYIQLPSTLPRKASVY